MPYGVFIFIHVPFFIKIILNFKYYKFFHIFTMHAIKNKKIRFRRPIFQTIINNNFKKHNYRQKFLKMRVNAKSMFQY